MSTVSGYHDRAGETDKGLPQLGHSKDYRPYLRQFKLVLATLDPVGIPLATATLSGEQTEDRNNVPTWKRLVATIGHPGFLAVGDCKLGSLKNRVTIAEGKGGCPFWGYPRRRDP
jgi:transposase